MIRHTFSFMLGIGPRLERHIWREGAVTWDDFLVKEHIRGFSDDRKKILDIHVTEALSALRNTDSGYFVSRLQHSEHWRLFAEFHKNAVCLDIETTGTYPGGNAVTVVGLYDCHGMTTFIQGINLDKCMLIETLSRYKLLITFAGRNFDIPFLEKSIPGFKLKIPHYDLCIAGHRLGIKGGLKKVEAYLGLRRDAEITGMSGYDAVLLWNRYKRGDKRSLDLLIKYNEADTRNLYVLAETFYKMLCNKYDILLKNEQRRIQPA